MAREGLTPREANATHHQNQYVHKRNEEDNESTACGSTEGAASLNDNDVNCPRCGAKES